MEKVYPSKSGPERIMGTVYFKNDNKRRVQYAFNENVTIKPRFESIQGTKIVLRNIIKQGKLD